MICWEETPSETWKWEQEPQKVGSAFRWPFRFLPPSKGPALCSLTSELCFPYMPTSFPFLIPQMHKLCLFPSKENESSLVSPVTHILEIYLESTGNELGDPGLPKQGLAPRALLQAAATSAFCQSDGPTDGLPRRTCA